MTRPRHSPAVQFLLASVVSMLPAAFVAALVGLVSFAGAKGFGAEEPSTIALVIAAVVYCAIWLGTAAYLLRND